MQYNKLFSQFLKSLNVCEKSKETYKRAINQYIKWLVKYEIMLPSKEDIENYLEYLFLKKLSPVTICSYLGLVKSFYKYLEENGIYPNIGKDVKWVRPDRNSRKEIIPLEILKRMLSPLSESLEDIRNATIINLMVRTGLRECSIINAKVCDLKKQGDKYILYYQNKGERIKSSTILIYDDCFNILQRYLIKRKYLKPDQPLFMSVSDRNYRKGLTTRTISRIIKDRLKKEGIDNPNITAHSLRHSFATYANLGGADIDSISKAMNHKNTSYTVMYIHGNSNKIPAEKIVENILKNN
jgi:integrase/recombinase XerD